MKLDLFLKLIQPRRRWTPYFVLVVTLLLTAFATYSVAKAVHAKERLRFENAVQRTQDDILQRLETYIALLRAGSGLFAASDRVSRDEFRAYVNRLDLRHYYPGIQGIGFSVRVKPAEKDALVADMQKQGIENFTLRPEFKRSEYHSIIYLEPLDQRNKVAIGFDMFTEPVRRATMSRARDTGITAASGRVTLVQEVDEHKQAGFLIYIPIYRNGVIPKTVAERRAALQGFVYSPFRVDDLIEGIFGNHKQSYIDFQIYDGVAHSPSNLLHRFSRNSSLSSVPPRFTTTKTILVAGRTWSIVFASRPEIEQASERSLLPYISLSGIAISFVLFGVTRSQVRTQQKVQRLNASLERQVTERTAQLQQALDFEATLKRITDKVRDSLDESNILQTAVQELVLGLGINGCNTALYDLEAGTSIITYEYTYSGIPPALGHVVHLAEQSELYAQLLQGQYVHFCWVLPFSEPIRLAEKRFTILACPIIDDQRVLGDMWLFRPKEVYFTEQEIRLLQQVANQCAIAIRQARLYQAATVQVKELEKLNALKDDFLSTVSHELRTPMSNMKMAISMLKNSPTAERSQRYLEILQNECTREIELINDLLDLQRLETASYSNLLVEAINLQDWLPSVIEPFLFRTQQRQQTLRSSLSNNLPTLLLNRASLERILAELLNNACKYTSAGGEIVLSSCYKSVEAATIFTISNSAEIPVRELPHIFEKFYRIPNADPWKQGGTGLGLALVQKLVEQLQGSILVESSKGWTTFTVELPDQLRSQIGLAFTARSC